MGGSHLEKAKAALLAAKDNEMPISEARFSIARTQALVSIADSLAHIARLLDNHTAINLPAEGDK